VVLSEILSLLDGNNENMYGLDAVPPFYNNKNSQDRLEHCFENESALSAGCK
jgi:hypothetical protein